MLLNGFKTPFIVINNILEIVILTNWAGNNNVRILLIAELRVLWMIYLLLNYVIY